MYVMYYSGKCIGVDLGYLYTPSLCTQETIGSSLTKLTLWCCMARSNMHTQFGRSCIGPVALTCVCYYYLFAVPSGTSEADSITAVNRVLAEINTAGTDYFRGLDLGGITLRSVRAALASGANKAHMAWGTLLSAVLSVVLLLAM